MIKKPMKMKWLVLAAILALHSGSSTEIVTLPVSEVQNGYGLKFDGTGSSGKSVAGAGDFNGDGIDDMVIGDYTNAFILFGSDEFTSNELDWSQVDGKNGTRFGGETVYTLPWGGVSGIGDIDGDGFADIGMASNGVTYIVFGRSSLESLGGAVDIWEYVDGETGFLVPSPALYSNVSGVGDINGDGFDDFAVANRQTDTSNGHVIVIFGSDNLPTDREYNPENLNGENGFLFDACNKYTGSDVAGLGDINGDGLDDMLIGSSGRPGQQVAGSGYVVFGKSDNFPATVCPDDLNGSNGFRIKHNEPGGALGAFVSGPGDVDGDGFCDFAIDLGDVGLAYLGYGQANFSAELNLISPTINRIKKFTADDEIHLRGSLGDIDGNSRMDLGFSNPYASLGEMISAGSTYVVLESSMEDNITLDNSDSGTGIHWTGLEFFYHLGQDVDGTGDVNADGVSDYLMGAPDFRSGVPGDVYIVFGSTEETSATYRTFAEHGDANQRGIGMLRNGHASSPESRIWIDYPSGHDGVGSASLEQATIYRDGSLIQNLNHPANVLWRTETNRVEWNSAEVMVKYVNHEIEGLVENELALYYGSDPTGPWFRAENQWQDVQRNRISGTIPTSGYLAIAPVTKTPANEDGLLDAADLFHARELVLTNTTPSTATLLTSDLCPVEGDDQITTADVQAMRAVLLYDEVRCE